MKTKKCFKCGEVQNLSAFYKHSAMGDGHLNKCIKCTKNDVRLREKTLRESPEYIEKEKIRARQKYHRLYSDKKRICVKKKNYFEKYPEKREAKAACKRMAKEGFHLHHWSYNKEHLKDVIYLEPKNHMFLHRYIVYDIERFMYRCSRNIGRFYQNDLLDTKEAHLEYYNLCLEHIPY